MMGAVANAAGVAAPLQEHICGGTLWDVQDKAIRRVLSNMEDYLNMSMLPPLCYQRQPVNIYD